MLQWQHDNKQYSLHFDTFSKNFCWLLKLLIPAIHISEIIIWVFDRIGWVSKSYQTAEYFLLRLCMDYGKVTQMNVLCYNVMEPQAKNLFSFLFIFRSDIESYQYQLTFEIPRIIVNAQYDSSGVLLLVKASGKGDYWGEYENIKAKVYLKAVPAYEENGFTYMTVETAKLDFSVKDIRMGVENIERGNAVLRKYSNFFLWLYDFFYHDFTLI